MKAGKTRLTTGLTMVIVVALFVAFAPPVFALPTADTVSVADASGDQGTYVVLPVTITNVQDGPIISIIFDVVYNNDVIEVVEVQNGDLISSWDNPTMSNFAWGTRVSIVYDGQTEHGLQDGSTGSIVLLKVSVVGELGETSQMNLTNIQLSDTAYELGTAPAEDGTFTIRTESDISTLSDTVEDIEWSEAYWEEDGLWHITERRSKSATHSWWYGQETTGTYDTGSANAGCLVSKTIDLTDATDATLNFWTYWQTESTSSTNWDMKMVELSTDGGVNWELLQQLSGSMQGDIALSLKDYVGNEVVIRFRFDTVDRYYNNYEGWFIDDITIEKEMPGAPDLTITSKSEEIGEADFTVTYTVTNRGNGDAGTSNTAIYIDGTNVLEDPVPALAASASYTNTVGPFECPCKATLAVTVCADNNNNVEEDIETNNCMVNNVECPGAEVIYVNENGWWREGATFNPSSTPIQAAIDNAYGSCGMNINVQAGTYQEQVIIIQ